MDKTEKSEQIELELDLEPLASEQKDDDIVIEEEKEPEVKEIGRAHV